MFDPHIGYAFLVLLGYYIARRFLQRSRLPLPPGPKPWPLVGSVTEFPPEGEVHWRHWLRHKDLYGPISSVTAMGQTLIIVHDRDAASELMEKRAANYSGRPVGTFANELCGFERFLVSLQAGPRFHSFRKLAHSQMGTQKALDRFRGRMDWEVHRLLAHLLDEELVKEPAGLEHALHMSTSAIILKVLFGYSIKELKRTDPLVSLNDRLIEYFTVANIPGRWLVDLIPMFKYVPVWLPGAGFQSFARKADLNNQACAEVPLRFVKRAEQPERSFVADLLSTREAGSDVSEHDIKYTAASLHAAGVETTTVTLHMFFGAMAIFPEVQTRAQGEIDKLLGPEAGRRMPGLEDRSRLPYVNAVVKEVLRWFPAAPMGVPHTAEKEDVYRGYRIPKGAIILPAIYWFTRDPAVYHEPESFRPERYLSPYNEPDPSSFAFGFGRRICPGKRLAEETIFLAMAKALSVLDVSKAVDEDGREIEPVFGYQSTAIIAHPLPFSVKVGPRSQRHTKLVRAIEADEIRVGGDAKLLEEDIQEFLADF